MKIKLLLALVLPLMAVSYTGIAPAIPMVRQIRNLITGSTSDYTYDKSGRIVAVKNSNGVRSTYEYSTGAIYRRIDDTRRRSGTIDTFILNAQGLTRELHTGGHVTTVNAVQRYEYDADGFQTVSKSGFYEEMTSISRSKYADSNEVATEQRFTGESWTSRGYKTYYTDRRNTIGNENMGSAFLGRSAKNLIKEAVQGWVKGDTSRTTYRYHYDDKGRVSIRVSYYRSKVGDSTAYTYY